MGNPNRGASRLSLHAPPRDGQGGVTLLQLLAGLAAMGVLCTYGVAKFTTYVKQRALQGEIQSLSAMARQSRAVGLKKNLPVGMVFLPGSGYRVFEDLNQDGLWQTGEPARLVPFARQVAIGPGRRPPPRGPGGETVPPSGLAGAWTTGLLFGKDPMATPNSGSLYLHHTGLDGWTACLVRSAAGPQIAPYLWDGTAWRSL